MPATPHRERLLPYKLLVNLEHPREYWANRQGQTVQLRTGPASRALRLRISQLHESLAWLKMVGLLKDYQIITKGLWSITLADTHE
jgi:hypothetical protein